MSKKFLLTGATGFVGRQVLLNLLNKKIEVRAIVRKGKENFFKDINLKVETVATDDLFKENVNWWTEQCSDIDTIIHIAWYTEPGKYLQSPDNIDCLIGSLNLAKGAMNAGVKRFIGIGTCFEYDLSKGKLSIDTSLKPTSSYASAKAALFLLLSKWLPEQSIKFSWCRLFYLYGEGENEKRFVPYLHKQLSKRQQAELTSGEQIRDFLDVSDAGRMISEVAFGNQLGPINICSGNPITIRQLAERVADLYNSRDLLRFGVQKKNFTDPPCILGVPNMGSKKNKK